MRTHARDEREMDLHHFFENMVRREETASAFLATLLEYDLAFRQAFLRIALGDDQFTDHEEWAVKVEEGRVDVTLESASTRVLIEDKLSAGAKQKDQLLRYYLAAVVATPGKRIVAVYLAPGGMGVGEVDAVERNALRVDRPMDFVCQLPWARVAEIIARLPDGERSWFTRSGMQQIELAIDRARQEKYPPEGDRGSIREIADRAVRSLADQFPGLGLRRWSARDSETIFTYKAPVTVYVVAAYEFESEPPYHPIEVVRPDGVHVEVQSRFKLAARSKRDARLTRRWGELVKTQALEVPGVGRHDLLPDGWFVHLEERVGSADEVVGALAETGRAALMFLRQSLLTDEAGELPGG